MAWRWTATAIALLGCLLAGPAAAQTGKPAAGAATASTARTDAAAGRAAAAKAHYAERFRSVCAECHGADGRSDRAGTPVLAGQHALYAITQLFLFREGRRNNETMVALAKAMTDADLRGYADVIGTLPPLPAPVPDAPPDAARMSHGLALAQQHKCLFCHGAALEGGQGVPRIGGQKEDYLRMTLHGLKSGERPAYTRAMTEALSPVAEADLDVLAYFVANFTGR